MSVEMLLESRREKSQMTQEWYVAEFSISFKEAIKSNYR